MFIESRRSRWEVRMMMDTIENAVTSSKKRRASLNRSGINSLLGAVDFVNFHRFSVLDPVFVKVTIGGLISAYA
jgi:hypothetical protein